MCQRTCNWSPMTPTHVHLGNDGGAVMDPSPDLFCVESFSVADVDVQTDVAGGVTETAILMTLSGHCADEPFRVNALFTEEQAADYAIAMANTVDESRRRRARE